MTATAKGLGWLMTALCIVSVMVGGGVVALPIAYLNAGLIAGSVVILVVAVICAYTAYLLGINWIIMQKRWPIYCEGSRKPFVEMAQRSMGSGMRLFTAIFIYATMFGTSVVYILLSSRIFVSFLSSNFSINISICEMIVIVSTTIIPLSYLKSPADYWFVIIIALFFTFMAVCFTIFGIFIDAPTCILDSYYPPVSYENTFLYFGVFIFAFSGHQVLPTIQHDMREPKDFTKSVILGFILISALYLPLAFFGYIVYGDSMYESVIDSIQTTYIRVIANLTIALHCLLAVITMANPLCLQVEHVLHVPQTFGKERVIVRTGVMMIVLLFSLTFPEFAPFMNFAGSLTNPSVCLILPVLFNLYLQASYYDKKRQKYTIPTIYEVIKRTNIIKLFFSFFIIAIALIGGVISVYLALFDLFTVNFTPPCYLTMFYPTSTDRIGREITSIRCCGAAQDILSPEFGNASEICAGNA